MRTVALLALAAGVAAGTSRDLARLLREAKPLKAAPPLPAPWYEWRGNYISINSTTDKAIGETVQYVSFSQQARRIDLNDQLSNTFNRTIILCDAATNTSTVYIESGPSVTSLECEALILQGCPAPVEPTLFTGLTFAGVTTFYGFQANVWAEQRPNGAAVAYVSTADAFQVPMLATVPDRNETLVFKSLQLVDGGALEWADTFAQPAECPVPAMAGLRSGAAARRRVHQHLATLTML